MKHLMNCIKAMAAGAIAMYYLDPDMGRRRRAMLGDKMRATCNEACRYASREGKHMANKARGMAHRARSTLADEPVDDYVLVERVRTALGRLVGSPGAVDVSVNDGIVSLAGRLPAGEIDLLIGAVKAMAGVRAVADHLTIEEEPGPVPGLQGGSPS